MKHKRLLFLLVLLLTATTGAWAQTVMTNGLFSVSATKKVYFSKGNLQLVGENTFQFAENQWDYFGINQSANHRDLFCWGTGNDPNQTTGNSTFTDWGDNTYLQATLGKGWRTLTKDEFAYVFNTRASGSSVFGTANGRYTLATINTDGTGVKGIILFPDGITIAADEVTTAGTINGTGTVTQCTKAQWAALAEKGCVFLPAAGFCLNASGDGYGNITDYWTSTAADASKAYNLGFNFGASSGVVNTAGTLGYNYGLSVRLVIDSSATYSVALNDGSDNPTTWTGKVGEATTFSALPLEGVAEGQTVTLKYSGDRRVKSVTATSDAGAAAGNSVDLSTLTADYEAQNGDVLTGTLAGNYSIDIAHGATVTLYNVNINGSGTLSGSHSGIECLGSATIILKGENVVKGFSNISAGISATNTSCTLTIDGDGSLTASSKDSGAGIGGIDSGDCANIVINGGTITANGGANGGAGIGGGNNAACGNITINGGNVRAQGGSFAAGIGCGSYLTGKKKICGDITINGGYVTAQGGAASAGIGSCYGYHDRECSCGNIMITGGTIEATGGYHTFDATQYCGAGIGSGATAGCGTITIANTVTKVTARRGGEGAKSIGAGNGATASCGTVTIGGTVYADGIAESPYTYQP